jgi:small neutral amino acid transporter SnatA (MarC family)
VTHLRSATNKKTVVVVTLLVVAMGLCWLSWRVGSPLMTTIRNTDVELELRNELEGLSSTPAYKLPR